VSLYYQHRLIPDQADYLPHPHQIADFYSALIDLGVAPRQAELILRTWDEPPRRTGLHTGRRHRSGFNPASGAIISIVDDRTTIDSVSIIGSALERLDEYELEMCGVGPSRPLFQFDKTIYGNGRGVDPEVESYEFQISCYLRPDVVSTSAVNEDDLDRPSLAEEAETLVLQGETCSASSRTGFFFNPYTQEVIRVPGAGCARFWIEFGFGKWLFPEMKNNSLDLLPANVVGAAQQIFGGRYLQGCCWG
jgi:hypothetical protein